MRLKLSSMLALLYAFQLTIMLNGFLPLLANGDRANGPQISSISSNLNYIFILTGSFSVILGLFIVANANKTPSGYRLNTLFVLSLIYAALTFTWSPYQDELYIYFLMFTIFSLNTILFCFIFDYNFFMKIMLYTCRAMIGASIFAVLVMPEVGIHQSTDFHAYSLAGAWRGSFSHKNALGQFAALLFFLELAYNEVDGQKIKNRQFLFLTAELACLIFAKSSGAYIGFIIALLFYVASKITNKNQLNALLIISPLVVIFLFFSLDYILPIFGKDSTFTGRTDIWNYWIGEANQNFLFGNGYFSSYTQTAQDLARYALFYSSSSPHSSYIEMYYFGGAFAISLFFTLICILFYRLLKNQRYSSLSLVICSLVLGFSDVNSFRIIYGFFIFLWVVLIYVPKIKYIEENFDNAHFVR